MPDFISRSNDAHHSAGAPAGRGRRDRLVVFADPRSPISAVLTATALRAARSRPEIAVVAVCDAAPQTVPSLARGALETLAATVLERLFDPTARGFRPPALLGSLRWSAWRHGVPFVVPQHRDVNDSRFVGRLRDELRPTMALSLACLQIFHPALLAQFEVAVNYHNALLPAYRGLSATGWSLYHGEPRTGYAFHHMTAGVDEGPTLLSGSLPVPPDARLAEAEAAKTASAAARLGELLDLMVSRVAGTPQSGTPSYFGRQACRAMICIETPETETFAELQRRLRAFGVLVVRVAGELYEVTRLVPSSAGGAVSFRTADGVAVQATRFLSLPLHLYRLVRRIRGIVTHG